MKKRSNPLLDGVPDRVSLMSIWLAQEGMPGPLAERLRQGLASKQELAMAADLIEWKIRPRRQKSSRTEDYAIAINIKKLELLHPKWQRKKIVGEVSKLFRVSISHVYDVLNDFDNKTLDQLFQIPLGSVPQIPQK
jgi:hypothetical protein